MTADIGRVVFYLGLIVASLSSYGECRGELPDRGGERITKPVQLENSAEQAKKSDIRNSPVVDHSQVPIASNNTEGSRDDVDEFSTRTTKLSRDQKPDDVLEDVKKKLAKAKKIHEEVDIDLKKDRKIEIEEPTRLEKPVVPTSRGKSRYQLDNTITENIKITAPGNGFESSTRNVDDVSKLPLLKLSESTAPNADIHSTATSDKSRHENSTRSAKSSFHYQGGDGYTFENQFAIDADRDDAKFDDRISMYPVNDPANNIDRMRNYNENSGNIKLKNIVRKPQGFTLTTESSDDAEILRKTVTRYGPTTKKRTTESPVYVPKTEIATDPSSTAVSRNEISRKPSMKPSSSYSSRRRVSTTAINDNSLPTTSTAWALASLKPSASAKVQKRPNVELKKTVTEVSQSQAPLKSTFVTTIKPFKSWSTKLQKTTTESATDNPTTMKAMEVDAETFAPMGLWEPKLMNISVTTSPKPTETAIKSEEKNETLDIHIDLAEDSKSPIVVADSSHNIVTDSMRYNYMVGNSSDEKNDTFVMLNVHQLPESVKHANVNEIDKSSKNEIETVSKSPLPKFGVVLKDEPSRVEVSSAENLHDKNSDLLNDVKSPSESNDFRNTTEIPSSSEVPRIDYRNTESNTIFDQFFKDAKKDVPVKRVESVNMTESNAVREIAAIEATKNFDTETEPKRNDTLDWEHDSKEVTTVQSPTYDIEIDDDMPTVASNETVFVNIKDWSSHRTTVASTSTTTSTTSTTSTTTTTTTTTTTEAPTTISSSTKPTLRLTTRTESLDDLTTTRRSTSKRVYNTPTLMTARPSTTMEILTMTYPSMDDFTTFNPYLTSMRTTGLTKKKNTKLSPAPPRATDKSGPEMTTISTSSTIRTTEETKRKYFRTTTTEEVTEPITTSSRPTLVSSSTELVNVYTLPNDHRDSEMPKLPSSSEKPAEVTVVIETTFHPDDLPMAPTFRPKLSPENVPGYLMLIFKSSFAYICQTEAALKENLFQYITERSSRVQSKNQVVMVVDPEQCKEPDDSPRLIPVALYVVDDLGSYDKTLIEEMQTVLDVDNLNNYTIPIHKIVYQPNFVPDNSRVIAAMIITSIAAVCFVLLIFLMCTIRNRQKLSYGQRCTPVSVDDYNLDNISEYNQSIRRKGAIRASKRSYGNPAFDDPSGPSKTLTYNGLIKACENRCALDEEFSQIPVITVKPEELPAGAETKNRYANVIPLPETRVSLSNNCSDSVNDYINANYVKGFKGADKFYIACQAPLQNTIEDFWKMIWKEQTKVIIMLTGLTENGVEKCADYLPPSEVLDCHRLFGDYQVTLKKREVKEKYVISSLQLKNLESNLWREVTHLWYTSWPTQGVPNEQSSIIALLIEARAYMRNSNGPHVVHCSPGTGRTGTVIACDICIRDYELTRSVNIPMTVAKLRRCRAGAVQTKEQYAFIYKVLTLYAKKLNGGTPLESL